MQGTIQRLIRGRGFGFIVVDDRQYFFHHTEVQGLKFKRLSLGDVVEFEAHEEEEGKNPRATAIVVVAKKEPPPRKQADSLDPPPRGGSASQDEFVDDAFGDGVGNRQPSAPRTLDDDDREFVSSSPPSRLRPDGGGGPSRRPDRGRGPAGGGFSQGRGGVRRGRPGGDRPGRGGPGGQAQLRPRAAGVPGDRGAGTVRSVDVKRGYGFIETPTGDIFFHKSGVASGFEDLAVGTRVTFVFEAGDRGSKADRVMPV